MSEHSQNKNYFIIFLFTLTVGGFLALGIYYTRESSLPDDGFEKKMEKAHKKMGEADIKETQIVPARKETKSNIDVLKLEPKNWHKEKRTGLKFGFVNVYNFKEDVAQRKFVVISGKLTECYKSHKDVDKIYIHFIISDNGQIDFTPKEMRRNKKFKVSTCVQEYLSSIKFPKLKQDHMASVEALLDFSSSK